jgi:hypothetical protein
MKIELKRITVRELTTGYKDKDEDGVVGYSGNLNIRPAYQREFVYKDAQRAAVIDTVKKGFPLNVLYWADLGNGKFEIIDGQQRTISICQYVNWDFSIDVNGEAKYFHNLPKDKQDQILNYELMVYHCTGTPSEKLEWFRIINTSPEKLTEQELLNSSYTGPWLTDAKKHFSKTGCAAYNLGSNYVTGSPIRQEYLEMVLDWISNGKITDYMAKHQHDKDANELWLYFQSVIKWVKTTFPTYRSKEMKGINWGELYNTYKDGLPDLTNTNPAAPKIKLDSVKIEDEISRLMEDEDVDNKKGIYSYVLTRKENKLHIREFKEKDKRTAFEKQAGVCPKCKKTFKIEEMEGDHITPWSKGGKTTIDNLQMLCKACNRTKSGV